MSTLLISPDYASHYYGLAALGREGLRRGARVIVATGPHAARAGARRRVRARRAPARRRSQRRRQRGGRRRGARRRRAARVPRRPPAAAWSRRSRTRSPHASTTCCGGPSRSTDRLRTILAELEPDRIVVDQLAYGATLALRALGRPFVSFLPSHPCQLPHPGEPDAFPIRFPRELTPPEDDLARLRALCERQTRRFTDAYNAALTGLNPAAAPVEEAASAGSPQLTVVAYPDELAPDAARPGVVLVGPVVREERADDALLAALARRRPRTPTVYVSLGTFLSAREDVLARIARRPARARRQRGHQHRDRRSRRGLGPFPEHWHVAPSLPQVAVLAACDAVVCHGGNNTVMEALSHGLPVLAGPMSSDQFVAAEDLRRGGVGDAFAPNDSDAGGDRPADRGAAHRAGARACPRARATAAQHPGAARAWALIENGL